MDNSGISKCAGYMNEVFMIVAVAGRGLGVPLAQPAPVMPDGAAREPIIGLPRI